MKQLLFYLCSLCLALSQVAAANTQIPYTDMQVGYLGQREGLSIVNSLLQDRHNIIWAATNQGLYQYYGTRFIPLSYREGDYELAEDRIQQVLESRDGAIWIATAQAGPLRYDPRSTRVQSFRAEGLREGLRSTTYALLEDRQQRIWASTDAGLFYLPKGAQQFRKFPLKGLQGSQITQLVQDSQGIIWIGTRKGIYRMQNERMVAFQPAGLQMGIQQLRLSNDRKLLWAATDQGLVCIRLADQTVQHYKADGQAGSLPDAVLWNVLEDRRGNLLVSTQKGLCVRYAGQAHFTSLGGEKDFGVVLYSSMEDRQGRVWLGTVQKGIMTLDMQTSRFQTFRHHPLQPGSLSHDLVLSFLKDRQGRLWVGTDGGGLNLLDDKTGTFRHFRTQAATSAKHPGSDVIMSLLEDRDGEIWLGTYDGGLDRYHPGKGTFLHHKHDPADSATLSGNTIKHLLQDKQGHIWAATLGSGLNRIDKASGAVRRYLKGQTTSMILQDHAGRLWVSTYHGLALYRPEQDDFQLFRQDNRQTSGKDMIMGLCEDRQGQLWVATYGGGIYRFDLQHRRFTQHIDKQRGLANNQTYCILEDGQGALWVSTSSGLSRISPDRRTIANYQQEDGLSSGTFMYGAALKDASGRLYFGTNQGFTAFDPSQLQPNTAVPSVLLTDLRLFNQTVLPGEPGSPLRSSIGHTDTLELDYDQAFFSISFAAQNYLNPEKNQYAYLLEGFDKDWVQIGNQHSAVYTNVAPGTYTFRVRASNNDGIWNLQGTSLLVIIHPPFWATWWFRTLVATLIVLGLVSFYLWRTASLKARQLELERQVADRTAEVVAQKEELVQRAQELDEANQLLEEQTETLRQQSQELQETSEELQLQNEEMHQQAEELEAQRNFLDDQNRVLADLNQEMKHKNQLVTSSIQYARTIQQAILPTQRQLAAAFTECFVLYRPKDIVSGDFYWFSQLGEGRTLLAVADCTGHGVPGAFMSVIGNNLLNRLVNEQGMDNPEAILEGLDQGVRYILKQPESGNTDGMDIALCLFERQQDGSTLLTFSGAKSSLYHYQQATGTLARLTTDQKSIGGGLNRKERAFANQQLLLQPADMLYLTTDGYADQANAKGKRFGTPRLMQVLEVCGSMLPERQLVLLEQLLDEHREGSAQRDDITLLGLRCS